MVFKDCDDPGEMFCEEQFSNPTNSQWERVLIIGAFLSAIDEVIIVTEVLQI